MFNRSTINAVWGILVGVMLGAPLMAAEPARGAASDDLETVEIVTQRQAFRGDVALEDLPQSVQILSEELLSEVGATRLDDALDYATGIARQNTFGGLWDSFAMRGFAGDENLPSGYLVNGFSGGRGYSGRRDTVSIASMEVLRGPGSALYGRSEPGGTVNLVTKKPTFQKDGYIELSAGSFSTYRLAADYTAPFNERVAFRINGAYEDGESFRDFITMKRLSANPSLLFRFGDSTTLSYELEINRQESPFDRGVVATTEGVLGTVPNSRFLGEPGDGVTKIESNGNQLALQTDFGSGWSLLLGASYRDSSFKGFSSDPELATARQPFYQALPATTRNSLLSRQRRYRDFAARDLTTRAEVSGTIATGAITHHLMAGADYYDYWLHSRQDRFRGTIAAPYAVNIFAPVYGQTRTPGPFRDPVETQHAAGFYVQDQMDLSDAWKMLIGVRHDNFSQRIVDPVDLTNNSSQTKSATSPRVGLVYEATDAVTLYLSYSEGFRPNSGSGVGMVAFVPEDSESTEVGAKFNLADGRASATIAVYDSKKSNFLTADPVNAGLSIAAGDAESQGLEAEIAGEIADGLTVSAGYAYTDAVISKSVADFNFGLPLPVGTPLINVPKSSANVYLNKEFQLGDATWSVGGGAVHVGNRVGETGIPTFKLPAYTLVNLVGSYSVSEQLHFTLNIDNIFDKVYYPSSYARIWVAPGAPRTWSLRMQYNFY